MSKEECKTVKAKNLGDHIDEIVVFMEGEDEKAVGRIKSIDLAQGKMVYTQIGGQDNGVEFDCFFDDESDTVTVYTDDQEVYAQLEV